MKKALLIATTVMIATAGAASAASINRTQERQADRIEDGRETGKITWTEGLKLRAEQNKIKRKEAEFRSDGYLSKSEYRTLKKMQNDASKDIRHEAHDGWKRAWWMPRIGL